MLFVTVAVIIHACSLLSQTIALTSTNISFSETPDHIRSEETIRLRSNSKRNMKVGGIKMVSIMLQHILQWQAVSNSTLYTVIYKQKGFRHSWKEVSTCLTINVTSCDLTESLHEVAFLYDVGVIVEPSNETNIASIEFCPEYDTVLLPPEFNASRQENVLFIRPVPPINKGTGNPITEQLETLEYQVKYWAENETKKRIQSVKVLHNTEITLQNLSRTRKYCIVMRLYEKQYAANKHTSSSSNWTEVVCLNSARLLTTIHKSAKRFKTDTMLSILGAVIASVVVVSVAYKIWKTCRYIHKVDPLPEPLIKTIQEMDSEEYMVSSNHILDQVDKICKADLPLIKTEVVEKHVESNRDPLVQDFQTGLTDEYSNVFEEKTYPTDDTKKDYAMIHKQRERNRSQGYHSASSECTVGSSTCEVLSEKSPFSSDAQKHINCKEFCQLDAQTQSALHESSDTTSDDERMMLNDSYDDDFNHTSSGENIYLPESAVMSLPDYIHENMAFPAEQFSVNSEVFPFENFTYCSNVKNAIPDVLTE